MGHSKAGLCSNDVHSSLFSLGLSSHEVLDSPHAVGLSGSDSGVPGSDDSLPHSVALM